ncbi:hypothetical protein BCR34DRAFT_146686 [Clohesyomyces aquaticus]|uniref:Uncharacterized protein n=1 Tax=Clohesyomyces aquaticus TaxID=1231657 RepID=A0A1Y1YL18_9PLEO|nr:hypothetical protein BCR34DRAFT_146686 [Clohesyomyces aquaticus]
MPPLLSYAPEALLAKQWLQAYAYGPVFVPPLILSGTLCNVLLAYSSPTTSMKLLYGLAAAFTWIIMPFTLLYMEPGVNGAGKWKVERLLVDEDGDKRYMMKENEGWLPRVDRHTATGEARAWAEGVRMRDIVERWVVVNRWRFWVTALAMGVSAVATCNWGGLLW